ncbi:alkaline phosphatase family protein [Arthrobacter sp. JZ12]|uniref:alkaline phosphatase D family protein n=1 Tax=Arthrobacter sp. JZ12 TaxID=2654190 RepID=UPI002B493AB1|nr:alkaline phosphatase D family protein [Arthrobacter sp. JZ12]WRH25274.1 alkaline phosphatase family protein [Arthrobacter sp. JZ12]
MTASLVLGPMLRYVDTTSASVWVETSESCTAVLHVDGREWKAPTFAVHGHHYALLEAEDLPSGAELPYTVDLDGERAWPGAGTRFPQPVVRTLKPGRPLRLAFGSCRTSVPHDRMGNALHGIDSMRAYALHQANADDDGPWPDLVAFLGDQVYADSTSSQMQNFIRSRRSLDEAPGEELKDYEEYAHLYRLAWSDDANRWLLSTLPSAMIFDDHDIRDDWNASLSWREKMQETAWWHGRIVAGLASYWVYQHLGNLSPEARAEDPLWQRILSHPGPDELDFTDEIDAFAERADAEPDSYRWSYCRDIGDVRLLTVDSRAARVLEPGVRSLIDEEELKWIDEHFQGGFRHLIIATSLPFLLPRGLHHIESWDEALAEGAWGKRASRIGEGLRQAVDLEHWAAFQRSFKDLTRLVTEVADGLRGAPPQTITFLSGDVHYSYVAEVERNSGSRIIQAVCSPIRNPLPRAMRFATVVMSYGVASPVGALVARSARVPKPPFDWKSVKGPWFDNNLAVLEDTGSGLRLRWTTGIDGKDPEAPGLKEVADVTISARPGTASFNGSSKEADTQTGASPAS